jgi:hypothetical protein
MTIALITIAVSIVGAVILEVSNRRYNRYEEEDVD